MGLVPPPNMPDEFKTLIESMGGSEEKLLIQKIIFSTDLSKGHNRLQIPVNKVTVDFLTETERRTLEGKGMDVLLVEQKLKYQQSELGIAEFTHETPSSPSITPPCLQSSPKIPQSTPSKTSSPSTSSSITSAPRSSTRSATEPPSPPQCSSSSFGCCPASVHSAQKDFQIKWLRQLDFRSPQVQNWWLWFTTDASSAPFIPDFA